MTPAELALLLLLVAVLTGYAAWRLPHARRVLGGLALGLGGAALALLRSAPRPTSRRGRATIERVVDEQAADKLNRIERADTDDLARLVNEGRRG